MRGGYQLLDLKSLPLTSGSASNIVGTWDAVNRSNRKIIVVTNLVINGEDGDKSYNDFSVYMAAGENIFEGVATVGEETISITVDNGDDVTVTVA